MPTATGLSDRRLRPALALAGVALAAGSWALLARDQSLRAEAHALLAPRGVLSRDGETARLVRFSDDEGMIGAVAARVALQTERRPDPSVYRPPGPESLEAIERLCQRVLRERPANAWAASALGGARLLRLSDQRDPRMWTDRGLWEAPLALATRLVPTDADAARLRAQGLLDIWFALSTTERAQARDVLRAVLSDAPSLSVVAPRWFEVANSYDEAFSLLPDAPEAWAHARSWLVQRGAWPEVRDTQRRWRAAAQREAETALALAERRSSWWRSVQPALTHRTEVVNAAPPSQALRETVERAAATLPPGAALQIDEQQRRAWIDWAVDRFLDETPGLSPTALGRLISVTRIEGAASRALAELAAGNPNIAQRIEREAPDLGEPWGPYLLAKSRQLARRGLPIEARAAFDLVPLTWRQSPLGAEIARRLGVPPERGASHAGSWVAPPPTWKRRFRLTAPALGVRIDWPDVLPEGTVFEWAMDGDWHDAVILGQPGSTNLRSALGPGTHLVEVRVLGDVATPGNLHPLAP